MTEKRRTFIKNSVAIAGGLIINKLPFSKEYSKDFFKHDSLPDVFVVPNMHPASCGWWVDFSTERNFCANNYLAHLDKVKESIDYNFVISEVNNMIAIMNFQPQRFEELKSRIKEERVEAVNGMFLELTPNLSGGEAIVRMGIHGIQWQKEVLGIMPRYNWMIDIAGLHEQLAQIGSGLGLVAQVHCRNNVSGSPLYFAESPDGTKLLTISPPGCYKSFIDVFLSKIPLSDEQIQKLEESVNKKNILGNTPYLTLGGYSDYSLPPKCPENPTDFIKRWKKRYSESNMQFSTLSTYLKVINPKIASGEILIPTIKEGWGYSYDAFWVQNPRVKSLYRCSEHGLQTAEMVAAIMSLTSKFKYPSHDLYCAWLQLHLNTDRNTLWGAATKVVFEDDKSWDVLDRFNWISALTNKIRQTAFKKASGKYLAWFNPVNWEQTGPQYITLNNGKNLREYASQKIGEKILFFPKLNSLGIGSLELIEGDPKVAISLPLPETVENDFYIIRIDPLTGEINNLSLKHSKKVIITKGAILCSEKSKIDRPIYHDLPEKKDREENASLKGKIAKIEYFKGDLAQIIKITATLYQDNDVQEIITIYNNHPRIDFNIILENLPGRTITFMDFISEYGIINESRGIPYGFSTELVEALSLRGEGVHPVICWSSYKLRNGAGFAILDRGVTGRQVTEKTVSVMLNVTSYVYDSLPAGWLSGQGKHHFEFAFVGYYDNEIETQIQQLAREFNSPPFFETSAIKLENKSFVSTSDNIIIQSIRRVENELEIRFVECRGVKGIAELQINLPVTEARLTNFLGEGDRKLQGSTNYLIPVRPQEIVTVRLKTATNVKKNHPLLDWSPLVPKNKRKFLMHYDSKLLGHPPGPESE
jgi:hypothetical protein